MKSKYNCPVCRDTGIETYEGDSLPGWTPYIYARDCTACGGKVAREKEAIERIERSGIPDRFRRDCELSSFKADVYKDYNGDEIDISKKMAVARSFVERFLEWEQEGRGLYIYSKTKGSGKTFLASCICNSLILRHAVNVRFVSASDLLDISKDDAALNGLIKAKVLVLDDLGQKTGGSAWMNDVLFKLLDERYKSKRVVLYTSNVLLDQLPFDERILDRIRDTTLTLKLPEIAVRSNGSVKKTRDFMRRMGL